MVKINPAIINGFPDSLPEIFKQFLTDCLELEQTFEINKVNMTTIIKSYERIIDKYFKNKEITDFITRTKA